MIQDQLVKLYELSQLDRQIGAIHQRVSHGPERRKEIVATLQEMERQLLEHKEQLAGWEKQKRELEGELQLSTNRSTEFQTKVNQIKTNKEYQAALKEIAETKKANKEYEDKILALMSEIETLSKQVESEDQGHRSSQETFQKELETLDQEEKTVQEESKEFEMKKRELLGSIEPKLLAQYERLRGSRDTAVAAVVRGACEGCHMRIPPQLLIEIQRLRSIHSCPSCQRILYLPGGAS